MALTQIANGDSGSSVRATLNDIINTYLTNGSRLTLLVNSVSTDALHPVYNATGNNWFVGEAGNLTTTGIGNVGIGSTSLALVAGGSYNVAIGFQAAQGLTSGQQNFAFGAGALASLISGSANVAIGQAALNHVISTDHNVAIGANAALATTATCGVFIGDAAGQSSTGNFCTFIGQAAGNAIAAGDNNAFFGRAAGLNITSGSNSTLIGGWQGPSGALSNVIALSDGAGNVRLDYGNTNAAVWTASSAVVIGTYTVAALPTAAVGMVAYVSDGAAALAWGATVTGGSTTKYLVWYNGTNWTVMGK